MAEAAPRVAKPDSPWVGITLAQVEAVQVGGSQYRVVAGSFAFDETGLCHWSSPDSGGLRFSAVVTALEAVRCRMDPAVIPRAAGAARP